MQEVNHFYGSLEPLKNLSKLKVLDISHTNIDSGLEYLPDSLETIVCKDMVELPRVEIIRNQNKENKTACSKIKEKLKGYSVFQNDYSGVYNFQAWKKVQSTFELLAKDLEKINPNLDVQEFFRQQGIFLNIATSRFEGSVEGLFNLIQINKNLFEEKYREEILLGFRVQELKKLIRKQKEKIIETYLYFNPEMKTELSKLIVSCLKIARDKEKNIISFETKKEHLKTKKELEEKLDK